MGMRCSAAPGRHALLTVSITALHCMLSRYHPVKNTVLLSSCEASLSVTPTCAKGNDNDLQVLYIHYSSISSWRGPLLLQLAYRPQGNTHIVQCYLNNLLPLPATSGSIPRVSPCSKQTHRLSMAVRGRSATHVTEATAPPFGGVVRGMTAGEDDNKGAESHRWNGRRSQTDGKKRCTIYGRR